MKEAEPERKRGISEGNPLIHQSIRLSDCALILLGKCSGASSVLKFLDQNSDFNLPTIMHFMQDQTSPWKDNELEHFVENQPVHQAVVIGDLLEPHFILVSLYLLETGFHVFSVDTELHSGSPERTVNFHRLFQAGVTPLTIQQLHAELGF